jgi:hypothetical protein
MKKMLKQYVQQTQLGDKDHEQVLKEFSRILDDQVQAILSLEMITGRYLEHHVHETSVCGLIQRTGITENSMAIVK